MSPLKNSALTDEDHRDRHNETRLNTSISRVLMVGLLVAIGLLLVGVVLTLVRPELDVTRKSFIKGIPGAIASLEPDGFFQAGLFVLLATPAARVAALLSAYARRRQWAFAGISLVVLAVLVLSAFLGLVG